MKSRFLWILGGLSAFIIFLLATLPAVQVIGRASLPPAIQLGGISGTIWDGHARVVSVNGITVQNVKWQLSPLSIVLGKLTLDIKAGNVRNANEVAFSGPVSLSLSKEFHIETQNFTLYLPVDMVLATIPLPLPVDAGGRFKVKLDELAYGPKCDALSGTGNWLNATVAGTQGPIDFGSYDASLRCEGEDVGIRVNEPNLLGLSMDAILSDNFASFTIEGRVKPDPSLPQEVHQAARFFGQPDAEGYIPIIL